MILTAQQPQLRMSVVVAETASELQTHVAAWESLGANAIEPNPFYEPWMLLPALRHLGAQSRLIFVLIYGSDASHEHGDVLCGLFPLELRPRYRSLPLPYLRLWKHDYCFLCTPLLRTGYSLPALRAFFDWAVSAANDRGIVEFGFVPAEGCFHDCLQQCLGSKDWPVFHSMQYSRPFLLKPANPEQYLRDALSPKSISTLGRHSRRLSEIANLEFASLQTSGDVRSWIQTFLELEASGWKGQAGTAMNCRENHRDFLESIVTAAFDRKQVQMEALLIGARQVAARCCLRSGRGLFVFKVAFDEHYARYSPGMLLEVECIRRLSAETDIDWADSCAAPDHPMWGRLWKQRRAIETVAVATKGVFSRRTISVMPTARNWYLALRRLSRLDRQTGSVL